MAKQGHARAPCLSVPALWRHQTASDFTALRSPGELGGGSPAVFSSSIPCAPTEGDCRDWKRVGFSSGEGGGAISLICDQHSKITRAGVISNQPQLSSASWYGEPRQARCQLWHSPGLRNNPTTPGSFHIIYLSWSFFLLLSLHRHKLQSWLKKEHGQKQCSICNRLQHQVQIHQHLPAPSWLRRADS